MIFASCDFRRLELHCYAQCCISWVGYSKLGEMLNGGTDPLTELAAEIAGVSYEEGCRLHKEEEPEFSNLRTCAKGCMYGFMGMLGPKNFPTYAKKAYGVDVTVDETRRYKDAWRRKVPESWDYERYIKSRQQADGRYLIESLFSGRLRLTPFITAACNSGFQGLGADAAGHAMFLVSEACYAVPESPLFGCRPVNFVHDEIITEVPEERGHEALAEQERLMVEGANCFLPDVPSKVDGKLSSYWSKKSQRIVENGRVVPWPRAA